MLHSGEDGEDKSDMVQLPEGVTPFTHITQNEFLGRKHKKLKDEDIAICECKYDAADPESTCGERCLNLLTSTECTPGYCQCGENCRNQRFQKCEYAKTKLFRTEGRGWGLLADEDIKAGQFIIEYCGEVISSVAAKKRSQAYEAQELKDAYIISLDANYFIDATRKGSFARFINHSCQPNCETRKWTVLGETRVGIFAKQDISVGMELAYNYNFEWYGGATVRCLCGAANCSIFLGAKSQGFQEYNHVWEEGDDRYTVEEVPIYDSAEDDFFQVISGTSGGNEHTKILNDSEVGLSDPMVLSGKAVPQRIGSGSTPKKSQHIPKRKGKSSSRKQVNDGDFAKMFASKEAREEVTRYEAITKETTSRLNSLYEEIRPTIEEHGRDNQDDVPTSVAEKWIGANCSKYKADFDLYFSVIKNLMCPRPATDAAAAEPSEGAGSQTANAEVKSSEGGTGPQTVNAEAEPSEGGA
ncbi:histone-lysine N-methyltransferase ASHH1-like isoform X1 [Lycium barbarum]|uniref:histone-lysine N-methyltransferase ASHH1-like isoform X1 n=1 Tax=Lycium barbarum TaxID=112863 RepID=UPI00293E798B|nr:histone-lysine N-methyltransferase ASHH1-like isoform X1 [Lycium barbarum]XP_060172144.1 histone-lysine N-methyltransferase ASHH1-like isoform X1 [Lycium barbarum]